MMLMIQPHAPRLNPAPKREKQELNLDSYRHKFFQTFKTDSFYDMNYLRLLKGMENSKSSHKTSIKLMIKIYKRKKTQIYFIECCLIQCYMTDASLGPY